MSTQAGVAGPCPQCGANIPVAGAYPAWCDACGWNLAGPPEEPTRQSKLDVVDRRLASRLGAGLAAEFSADTDLRPRLTRAKAATYVLAVLTLALALFFVFLGVVLLGLGVTRPNIAFLVLGALSLGIGVLMRPRLGRAPEGASLSRHDAPTLHRLVDDVAAALETGPAGVLVVDDEWNASWSVTGLRRVRVLTLGLPLFRVLGPQERVALVAHELAHGRNGDARRGLLVGSAWRALAELYAILAPDPYSEGVFDGIFNLIFWLVSRPVYAVLLVHGRLTAHDAHRAEYLADALAARVAGTEGAARLLEAILLEGVLHTHIVRLAQYGDSSGLIETLADDVRAVPERERLRRRRLAELERSSLDAFHPPVAKRMEVLEARTRLPAAVTLSVEGAAAIDRELAPLHAGVERRIVDAYRDLLYAG